MTELTLNEKLEEEIKACQNKIEELKNKIKELKKEKTIKKYEEIFHLWLETAGDSKETALKLNCNVQIIRNIICTIRKRKKKEREGNKNQDD
jgi:hypothetical protein